MKRKIIAIVLLLALTAFALSACAKESYEFADKVYIYETLGAGGAFTITINADGTFKYDEGSDAGYKGVGEWTYKDGILNLCDDLEDGIVIENNFRIEDGNLIFLSEGSTNYTAVEVEDGDKFIDITGD